jgi:hypothetical protein
VKPKRPDSESWKDAKARGDEAERRVAEWFKGRGFEVTFSFQKAEYDLMVLSRVEVKRDDKASKTGNLAIEVAHKHKPSGIMKTTADFWVFVVGTEAIMVQTDSLRDFIKKTNIPAADAGDNKKSSIIPVPINQICELQLARRIRLG